VSARSLRAVYREGAARVEASLSLRDGALEGHLVCDGERREVSARVEALGPEHWRLTVGERTVRATVARAGDVVWVCIDGECHELRREEPGGAAPQGGGEEPHAASPMTGTLAKVAARAGERVAAGAELFVVEAMKMEYVVRAPREVLVAEVRAAVGAQVRQGEVVVVYGERA
jgi:3-methylcrotonyl-CoA carboxylase alpha subunit